MNLLLPSAAERAYGASSLKSLPDRRLLEFEAALSQLCWQLGAMEAADEADPLGRYAPHAPWPRQKLFLELPNREAFYGGAAAGGKSEALLMAALRYVHVPGYAALILRKDLPRLRLAGGLITRAHEWFANTQAQWTAADRRWSFSTGGAPATLSFGYLRNEQDKHRYDSSEFQFIAFDELTEFEEDDYLYLFSRLRRSAEIEAPLRMRSASNPGGAGHAWVKKRFLSQEAIDDIVAGRLRSLYEHNGIAYVPARIADNPAINAEEYRESLNHLPPVVRERLMNGDWTIANDSIVQADWLRRYGIRGTRFVLYDRHREPLAELEMADCLRFATIDPAGTSADKANENRGRPRSWTVVAVWDAGRALGSAALLLRHVWREQVDFPALREAVHRIYREWKPAQIWIENEKLGTALAAELRAEGLPIETIPTGGRDKQTRATPLVYKFQRGEVYLPDTNENWLADFESELLTWTGQSKETCDQIDAAAYAAIVCNELRLGGNGPITWLR